MTSRISYSSDRQIADPLLCRECENLFSKNGEIWVLENGYRGKNSFTICKELGNSQPIWSDEKSLFYSAKTIPSIDISKLVYFAASIFWRASVRLWMLGGQRVTIDLGREYNEQLRLFLLGQTVLPANVAISVGIAAGKNPFIGFVFPFGGRQNGYHMFRFSIPGIMFNIFLGKRVPPSLRAMCILRSPDNIIFITRKIDEIIERDFASLYLQSSR